MKESLSKKVKKKIRARVGRTPEKIAKELGQDVELVRTYMKNAGLVETEKKSDSTPMDAILALVEAHAFRIVIAMSFAYALYLFIVTYTKYATYAYTDFDFAIYVQMMYNTLHGNIAHTPICTETILQYHQCFTMFLLLPFYAVLQYPWFLLLVQAVALGVAAIPLYLLAKKVLSKNWGVLFALAYLLYPPKTYANLFDFHPIVLALPLLIATFYFWHERKWIWFLVFSALTMLTREDAALVVFMFTFMSLWRDRKMLRPFLTKKNAKWIIYPALASLLYFIITTQIIAASFRQGKYVYVDLYRDWGGTLPAVGFEVFTHPFKAISYMLSGNKSSYLLGMFIPVAYLSVFSPLVLLTSLPIFMANLLSTRGPTSTIYFQYVIYPTAVIFVSAVFGTRRVLDWYPTKGFKTLVTVGFMAAILVSAFSYGPMLWPSAMMSGDKTAVHLAPGVGERAAIFDSFIEKVPPDGNLTATFRFLPHVAQRKEVESFHYVWMSRDNIVDVPYKLPEHTEWGLVDMQETKNFVGFWPQLKDMEKDMKKMSDTFELFKADGRWGVVDYMDDVVILKKGHKGGPRMVEISPKDKPKKKLRLNYAGNQAFGGHALNILGATLEVVDKGTEFRHLSADLFCKMTKQGSAGHPYRVALIQTRIVGPDGALPETEMRALGTWFYPTQLWKPGTEVVDRMRIYLPPGLTPGTYQLEVAIFDRFGSQGIECVPAKKVGASRPEVFAPIGSFVVKRNGTGN